MKPCHKYLTAAILYSYFISSGILNCTETRRCDFSKCLTPATCPTPPAWKACGDVIKKECNSYKQGYANCKTGGYKKCKDTINETDICEKPADGNGSACGGTYNPVGCIWNDASKKCEDDPCLNECADRNCAPADACENAAS